LVFIHGGADHGEAMIFTAGLIAKILLPFPYAIGNSITRNGISSILQLTSSSLLAHASRRRFDVLLQAINRIGERVFPLGQLIARTPRILVLPVLSTATSQVFHVFRNLTLTRRCLCRALSQITNLLLPARLTSASVLLTTLRPTHLLQTLLCLA